MTPPVLIEHLPGILKDFPGISLVYLFGSQVTGQVGPMSDFDLAIIHENGMVAFIPPDVRPLLQKLL